MFNIQYIDLMREDFAMSAEMGSRLLGLLDNNEIKSNTVLNMVLAYEGLNKPDAAEELLKKHEGLCRQYQPEAVDTLYEEIHRNQKIIK